MRGCFATRTHPIISRSQSRSSSELMSSPYQEFAPPKRLQPYLECFWTKQSGSAVSDYPVLPDGCVDIVYSPSMGRELQLVGTMTSSRKFSLSAGDFQFGVRFRPGMSQAFLPVPGVDTVNQSIALSDIWGADSRRLTEQISEGQSTAQCIGLIEQRLTKPAEITLVQRLCASIAQQAGQVRIDELTFQAGLSARQLRRLFLEQVGLSPKHFCRVIRFRNSLSRLSPAKRADWVQVALDCGYYDQAHFINEFRQFSGYTPGEFVALER
jgi:AraC-like DNA-binding protein